MTDRDELRSHNFDGIQEYDNDLPKWWVWLFVITVIFAVVYPFLYDFGPGEFASESIDKEMAAVKSAQTAAVASTTAVDEAGLMSMVADKQVTSAGAAVFAQRCVACHKAAGEGDIGPNLTDDYWIHGGKITDIRKIVETGVLEKGMLAWKGVLSPKEIDSVVAYIWTLNGTNPPNAKAPQGEKFERQKN